MNRGFHARVLRIRALAILLAGCLMLNAAAKAAEPDQVPVIDVLLVYTPAALLESGAVFPGQRMVDEANRVLRNSEARARVRLVHMAKVAYVEPSISAEYQLQFTLDRLLDPADGYLDEVAALREQCGADVVVLMAAGPDGFVAPLRADAAHAFGVLTSTSEYTFTRVLGRLLGCEAQRGPVEQTLWIVGDGAFVDSHAYVTKQGGSTFSTVMGSRLTRAPVFSNPDLKLFGSPMGIADEANNVRTINLIAPEVASFRGGANWVKPPQVQWQWPEDGALLVPGADINLQVAATAATGVVQKVEFYLAKSYSELNQPAIFTNFHADAAGHFRLTLTNSPPGWYRVSACATDEQGEAGQASIEFRVRGQNDDFTNRIQLLTPKDCVPLELTGMTLEPGEEALAGPEVEATAWYTWMAPEEGFLQAQARPKNSWYLAPLLRAYYGPDLASLVLAGVNSNSSSPLLLRVHAGETVQLSAGCSRTRAAPCEITADFLPLVTNDSFETRLPLTGPSVLIAGHNMEARSATNAVWQSPPGPTVWWTWTPSVSGIAQFNSSNFVSGQVITVFRGDRPETLSMLTQRYPGSSAPVEQGFPVQGGEALQIAVSSWTGNRVGAFALSLSLLPSATNSLFANRLIRNLDQWSDTFAFPGEHGMGVPSGVGAYAAWWEWTAPRTGKAVVAVNTWGLPQITVFTGATLGTLQTVLNVPSGSGFAAFATTAGRKYQLALSWPDIPSYVGASYAPVLHVGFPPVNDNFAQRSVLSGMSVDWSLTNCFGTREAGEPDSGALASWWYSWTAPARGRVTLSATGQVAITVYGGYALGQLTNVPYWHYEPTFIAEPGVQYQIAVWVSGLSRPVSAHMHLELQSTPAHDEFAARQVLTGSSYRISADLANATASATDPVFPSYYYFSNPQSLWWRWIIPVNGAAKILTSASMVGIYRLESNGTLVPRMYCGSDPQLLEVKAGEVLELMLVSGDDYPASLSLELLAPWPNDSFGGRVSMAPSTINPLAFQMHDGTTYGATREAGEYLSCTNATGHSRWWSWKTPVPAIARFRVSSTSPVYAEQFCGNQLSSLTSVCWQEAPYTATLRFHAVPGVEYPLAVDSASSNNSSYQITGELTPDAGAPASDLFTNAQVLEGPAAKVRGTHRSATAESGEPSHGGLTPARSLWFRWTAPRSGRVRLWAAAISSDAASPPESYAVGTLAQPHRPGLGIYQGSTLHSLQAVPSLDVFTTNVYQSTIEFQAIAGQNYALALEGGDPSDADVGEFELQLVQLPTNDNFADRIRLQEPVAALSGSVFGATRATNEWTARWPYGSPKTNMMNAWWQWTAPADMRVTLRNLHPDEHYWAVWRSSAALQWGPQVSVMDLYFGWEDSRRDFVALAGTTCYIAVYAYPTNTTPVEIELEGVPIPVNDQFAGRLALTGERVRVSTRCDNSSRELNEPPHGIGVISLMYGEITNAPSLWWSWTAPRAGLFSLSTEAQDEFKSQLTGPWDEVVRTDCFVYEGDQLPSLSRVAVTAPDTTYPPPEIKRVTFAASAGATYQIALCPLIRESRLWDTKKYFVNLAIDPVIQNSSSDTALELAGVSPSFSGNLSTAVDGLWWRWTAPETGTFAFAQSIGGPDLSWRLHIAVYRRDVASGNLVSVSTTEAQAGETYWFKVLALPLDVWDDPPTWDGRDLPFAVGLALRRQATNNDNFAQREQLTGAVAVLLGDNTGATREPGEPMHGEAPGGGSLWWTWTAPHSGDWTLARWSSPYAPLLLDVYRGESLSTLERVPMQRNALRNSLVFQAEMGVTYAIAIDRPTSSTGAFKVDLFGSFPPVNDSFAGRIRLDQAAPIWTARNIGASAEAGEPYHAGCEPRASTWWAWTAQNSSPVILNVSRGDYEICWGAPRLAIYSGDSLATLMPVGDNLVGGELVSNLTFQAEAGVSYAFALDTLPQVTGVFQLKAIPTNAPMNDSFERRFALTGSQVRVNGINFGATTELNEPNPPVSEMDATVWWSWTAPASGPTLIDTYGSNFDTRLAVYRGGSLGLLSLLAMNDDVNIGMPTRADFTSSVVFNAQGGTTYQIQVGSARANRGVIAVNIHGPNVPPAQLLSAEVVEDGNCQLRLRGTPGQTVWIEASNDLVNWESVGSVRFDSVNAIWTESVNPEGVGRFYRLLTPQ